ncbi:hypothetical protein VNO80_16037 [Phaseolus coccineus]|uniref:Uncharacterized protein n=1 Tax=Phaseolus coccineus TaxID=3886 RepID=A0AAN9MLC7_PHACN
MEAAATETVLTPPFPLPRPSVYLGRPSTFAFPSNFAFSIKLSTSVSVSISKQCHGRHGVESKKGFVVRATSSFPESSEPSSYVAPPKLESPIGQFLSLILMSHPHIVSAAVEQQLEL